MGSSSNSNGHASSSSVPGSSGSGGGGNGGGGGSTAVNPDKAIARLLYAMLKQKSLKDIDWNQVARDPVLLEEISNGHAARMRYSRFRAAAENHKAAVSSSERNSAGRGSGASAPASSKDATGTAATSISSSSSTASIARTKSKVTKPKRDSKGGVCGKRLRETEKGCDEDGQDENKDEGADGKESKNINKGSMDTKIDNMDTNQAKKEDRDPDCDLDGEDDTAAASFSSSLPSPPTESVPTMEPITEMKRKKMRKMMAFSPTMKAQPMHQVPLAAAPTGMRIHSLPSLPTTASAQQQQQQQLGLANLGGVLMMRHHSAGSASELPPHSLRTTRLLTPCSDIDPHHSHPQLNHHHHHHHTQPALTATGGAIAPDFDFTFATANTAAVAAAHYSNNNGTANSNHTIASSHSSPWMATPFSSPPMGTFPMSPYAGSLDMTSFAPNGDGGSIGSAGNDGAMNSASTTSLFALVDHQQQQQQQQQHQALLDEQALQATFMAHAFAKQHGGWDAMIGQGGSSDGGPTQGHHHNI